MSYIEFDKQQLVNLEYSQSREIIRSNRAGAYASRTLVGCHTRKYHGLLVVPQPALDDDNHVLLSNFDETVIQHNAEFNLGIHKYPGGVYYPRGHKYAHYFLPPRFLITFTRSAEWCLSAKCCFLWLQTVS
jgi:predicted glycogen debranching enzyme